MILRVYPTSRAIREQQQQLLKSNQILDKMVTIDTFLDEAIIVKDRKLIDSDSRVLMLQEASRFDDFQKLGFERDFLNFLKNSDFFFKFFAELNGEKVSIETLQSSDIYLNYKEHLDVLENLLENYKKVLKKHKFYDKIVLDEFRLNSKFFKEFKEIVLYIDGYLTKFELDIISQISKIAPLKMEIFIDSLNIKMLEKLEAIGFKLEKPKELTLFTLDISKKEVIDSKTQKIDSNIEILSFANRVSEANFVFKKIYDYIEVLKLEPENIAVILPDESFAKTLKLFDKHRNLNFAMGTTFDESLFFKRLEASFAYLIERNRENLDAIERFGILEIVKKLERNFDGFIDFLEQIKLLDNQKAVKILVDEEIFKFKKLKPQLEKQKINSLFSLFSKRVKELSINDVKGGKIKVIGLLEARYIKFDAVIIVDFNDEIVPKISQKDIFLNSQTRENAKLPSKKDRENLQKYYYKRVFQNSKNIAISYVNSGDKMVSRFLSELGLSEAKVNSDEEYKNITFQTFKKLEHFDDEIKLKIDLQKEIFSHSKLKALFDCKRKYYFRYIKKLKDSNNLKDLAPAPYEIGNILHNALNRIINPNRDYIHSLKQDLTREVFELVKDKNEFFKFEANLIVKKLNPFIQNEIARFEQGYRVAYSEKSFNAVEFDGFKIMAKIDRIDTRDGDALIIDYKSGNDVKINKNDFQLLIYSLCSGIDECYLYDIFRGKMLLDDRFDEKKIALSEKLSEFRAKEINFEKCESKSNCNFCEYKIICDRE